MDRLSISRRCCTTALFMLSDPILVAWTMVYARFASDMILLALYSIEPDHMRPATDWINS